jgi:hypothetical protein
MKTPHIAEGASACGAIIASNFAINGFAAPMHAKINTNNYN